MNHDLTGRKSPPIVAVAVAAVSGLGACGLATAPGDDPSGKQEVASEGVRISVPAEWPRNAVKCGTPVRDTYVVDLDIVAGCSLTPAPRVDYAEIRRSRDLTRDPAAAIATDQGDAAGHPVRRGGDVLPDGRTRRVVVVADQRVVVIAVADDPADADAIARSLRVD
ncbi:hypothetical protein O7600_25145 [Micromonospora sp. WMMA1998]|uniref:hypothetical protein n=1 Tax=Micromonospora sp. WMMA1998 TaxID=3015167 RepID=UPI00248CDF1B|nr:hypothetical protein [Micromonospora sp. WMMA1998]WBC14353.1 hypothetical protein O7600_25145 [Micromonospora sp. WMMA1998]